jgi:hypothetical protein
MCQENNLKMRRNLRGEIERRNLQINSDFLAAFETVKESLDQIHSNVKGMSDSCRSMQVGALRGISRSVSSAFAGLGNRILLNFQQLFSKKHNIFL